MYEISELGVNFWDWITEVQSFLGYTLTIEESKIYQKIYLEEAHAL